MINLPNCPQCSMPNTYHDGIQLNCADCAYEWNEQDTPISEDNLIVKDCNGNLLQDGDSVILAKDLKVKGSSLVIKKGTKVKSIKLVDADHNVDCKIDGMKMALKSEFLKKA